MKNIEVYTIDNCSYCSAAKSLLAKKNLSFKEINITGDDAQREQLIKKTAHRTMPQIFIDGQFVGGYTELKEYLEHPESQLT
jgi:glutaredoxin